MTTARAVKQMVNGTFSGRAKAATPVNPILVAQRGATLCTPGLGETIFDLNDLSNGFPYNYTGGYDGSRYIYFADLNYDTGNYAVSRYDYPSFDNHVFVYENPSSLGGSIYGALPDADGNVYFYEEDSGGDPDFTANYGAWRIVRLDSAGNDHTIDSMGPTDSYFTLQSIGMFQYHPTRNAVLILAVPDAFNNVIIYEIPASGGDRQAIYTVSYDDSSPYNMWAVTPDGSIWGSWYDLADDGSTSPQRIWRLDAGNNMHVSGPDTGYGWGFYADPAMVGTRCGGILTTRSLYDAETLAYFLPDFSFIEFTDADNDNGNLDTEQRVDRYAIASASPDWKVGLHSNTADLFENRF